MKTQSSKTSMITKKISFSHSMKALWNWLIRSLERWSTLSPSTPSECGAWEGTTVEISPMLPATRLRGVIHATSLGATFQLEPSPTNYETFAKRLDKVGQYGQNVIYGQIWTMSTKLDNLDEIGQYGQNLTVWTKLDNMDRIGQYGQFWTI